METLSISPSGKFKLVVENGDLVFIKFRKDHRKPPKKIVFFSLGYASIRKVYWNEKERFCVFIKTMGVNRNIPYYIICKKLICLVIHVEFEHITYMELKGKYLNIYEDHFYKKRVNRYHLQSREPYKIFLEETEIKKMSLGKYEISFFTSIFIEKDLFNIVYNGKIVFEKQKCDRHSYFHYYKNWIVVHSFIDVLLYRIEDEEDKKSSLIKLDFRSFNKVEFSPKGNIMVLSSYERDKLNEKEGETYVIDLDNLKLIKAHFTLDYENQRSVYPIAFDTKKGMIYYRDKSYNLDHVFKEKYKELFIQGCASKRSTFWKFSNNSLYDRHLAREILDFI